MENADNESAKTISRIDFRVPYENYISVHGKVTEQTTNAALEGIDVTWTPKISSSNVVVPSYSTNSSGEYYLVVPEKTEGTVMFTDNNWDPANPEAYTDHLNERIRVNGSTTQDITGTYSPTGETADPAMIQAEHIIGHLDYENLDGDTYPAANATIAYTKAKDTPTPEGWDGWESSINDGYVHGFAKTDENGNYFMKIKKGVSPAYEPGTDNGAYVWFTYDDPAEGAAALDCRIIQKDGQTFTFNTDLELEDVTLMKAGGEVHVKGDQEGGHAGFEIIEYSYGSVIGEPEIITDPTKVFEQTLAKAGKVFTSYDNQGRNVLRYVFDPHGDGSSPVQFEITIRPIAADGSTYWK